MTEAVVVDSRGMEVVVIDDESVAVIVDDEALTLVAAGEQGPPGLDSGGLSTSHDHVGGDGAAIPLAGLDVDNGAADGDLLSFSAATGKLTWLKSVTYQPTAGVAVTGNVTVGTFADAMVRGGTVWTIQEVSGVPGYNVQLTFSSVANFNEIRAYMRYQGGGTHLCQIELQVAPWGPTDFVTLTSFNSQNGLTDVVVLVDNAATYIQPDGTVTVRFYHPITGNTGGTHFLYLDMVNLIMAATGGGGVTDHRALSNRLDPDAHPASAIALDFGMPFAGSTAKAALEELQSGKIAGVGTATISVGTTAHANPLAGDLWVDIN